jgi:hypothetical protein
MDPPTQVTSSSMVSWESMQIVFLLATLIQATPTYMHPQKKRSHLSSNWTLQEKPE